MVAVPRPGKLSAFERFYRQHFPRTRAVLTLMTGDVDLAEEATQEAFVRAFGRWKAVRTLEHPDRWLAIVALNVVRDAHRSRKRQANALRRLSPIEVHEEAIEDRLDVMSVVMQLPPRQRQVVVLRYLVGLDTADTAKAMRCAQGTVQASLAAAMKNISEKLGERDHE